MANDQAAQILSSRLQALAADKVPGCVFHITRNGEPYADASFGYARLPNAPNGTLQMDAQTLVHTGSCAKFICAVAILRLIQETQSIYNHSAIGPEGRWRYLGAIAPGDTGLVGTVLQHGAPITLDTLMFPLVQPLLDTNLISGYQARTPPGNQFPGANVASVTMRQLLNHTSGLTGLNPQGTLKDNYDDGDLGGLTRAQVDNQPADGGPTTYDLATIVTALLREDAVADHVWRYNNSAYTVLGAIIKATTGREYAEWVHDRLFSDPRFSDIARKPVDPARAARYYVGEVPASFGPGNMHPDYTNFSAAGGWYMSAAQMCDWLDTLMQKKPVAPRSAPILDDPEALIDGMFGLDEQPGDLYRLGRLRGATKNGEASPGGGGTTAILVFLRGYADERVCVFSEINAYHPADELLVEALPVLRVLLGGPPVPIPSGLFQTAYWDDSGTLRTASQAAGVAFESNIPIAGEIGSATDLFGSGDLAGGRGPNDIGMVELQGLLSIAVSGPYAFRLSSDDGSALSIDGQVIIDNWDDHALQSADSQTIELVADSSHFIRVQWYNANGGPGSLYLQWKAPSSAGWEAIPTSNFTPA